MSTDVVDWMWGMFLEMGPRGDDSCATSPCSTSARPSARSRCRSLLVHGRKDGFVAFSGAEAAVPLYPEARLVAFDASGHAPHLEERDTYLAELLAFLDQTAR